VTTYSGKERREGWSAWQDLVIDEIRESREISKILDRKIEETKISINTSMDQVKSSLEVKIDSIFKDHVVPIKQDIAGLNVKAGMWGAIAGSIPVVIALFLIFMKHKFPEVTEIHALPAIVSSIK
jgi:hypothetical protein